MTIKTTAFAALALTVAPAAWAQALCDDAGYTALADDASVAPAYDLGTAPTVTANDIDDCYLGADGTQVFNVDDALYVECTSVGCDIRLADEGDDLVAYQGADDGSWDELGRFEGMADTVTRINMEGGSGPDTLVTDLSRCVTTYASGAQAGDVIKTGCGADFIHGGTHSDAIHGGAGADVIDAHDGADYVNGGSGHDDIYGGNGPDWLIGDLGNDYIEGGDGDDSIAGSYGSDEIYGGDGEDFLSGGDGNDYIRGNDNRDIVYGGAGNDELYGNHGKDVVYGGEGEDVVSGGRDDDYCGGESKSGCESKLSNDAKAYIADAADAFEDAGLFLGDTIKEATMVGSEMVQLAWVEVSDTMTDFGNATADFFEDLARWIKFW